MQQPLRPLKSSLLLAAKPAFLCLILVSISLGAEPIRAPIPQPRLLLPDGEFVSGELRDSNQPGILRIQAAQFSSPFEFPLSKVEKLELPGEATREKAHGEYCFELSGGDLFFGKLLSLTATELEVESESIGRVKIQVSRLRRIASWDGVTELIYMGPNGLTGWTKLTENAPKEEGGSLLLDQERTTVFADLGLPEKSLIECEIAYKGSSGRKPEFALSLGVSREEGTASQAFGLEVWENEVVARRETRQEADVEKLADVSYGTGRLHLLIYLDQAGERMLIYTPEGKRLADLKAKAAEARSYPGIRLANKKGEVRLERLRISRWVDNPVAEVQADQPRVHQKNGEVLYGTPTSYDPATRTFQFEEDKKATSVPADRITNIHLPESPKNSVKETKPDAGEVSSDGEIRLVFRNGTRISGRLKEIKAGKVVLHGSGISGEIAAPLNQLQTLMTMQEKKETPSGEKAASMVFVGDGIRLRGELSPTLQGGEVASILSWSPRSGNGAVPFRATAAGRILSREKGTALLSGSAAAASTPAETGQSRVVFPGGAIAMRRVQGMNTAPPSSQTTYRPPSLYLRTGDTIPCRVTRIDEKGVSFESSVAKSKFIPHDKIKAVELVPRSSQVATHQPRTYGVTRGSSSAASDRPRLDETKRDRLLTLPRMQRNNPPTHLIVATNKDILRGRIVSMDEVTMRVELRLETREILRERIGRIIWLHADELEGKSVTSPAFDRNDQKPRVHAVSKDGNRFTFLVEKLEGEKLSGSNDVLGSCEAHLGQLDELLLGSEIEQAATQLAYQQWKLHYAEEPLIAEGGDSESSPNRTGLESPLVGKPAPSFSLDLVKPGEKFSLETNPGKVIILDFWASWCGPCMQTIPQVHAVAEEFRDQGVELIGVNLEEAPQQIRAALARLKLQMTVAMDKEGKVGGLYGVTSIPKTVIIDREGKVARVYVGGHGSFANELRDALKAVIAGKKSEPAPAKP